MAEKEASLDLVFSPTDGVKEETGRLAEGEVDGSLSDSASFGSVVVLGRQGLVFFSGLFLFLEGTSAFFDFYVHKR